MDKSIEWSMKTREEILAYGLSFPDTYQEAPFHDQNWQLVRVRESKKAFLWTYMRDGFLNLNVKADPQWRDFWRSAYPAVIPGYHQNKEHWNTIIVDGTIPDKDICRMIAESYDLVTDSPTRRIYEAVKKIPKGQVATYGQVAELAGNKRMSRAVGNALHKNKDPENIPCYRVVNAKGGLSGAFIPVSEDQGMIDAVECGCLTLEKLEAMTCVCSVGLDMIAIPGDTKATTISGLIADEMAIGMVNQKTTAVRVIPVIGKGVGETVEFGGLLGHAPIMPVNSFACDNFVNRGGRIPAPIHSFKN